MRGPAAIRRMDDAIGAVLCLDALAWVAAARHEAARAADPGRGGRGGVGGDPGPLAAPLRAHHDAALGEAREALPGAEYRAAFAKGSAMDQAEAIAFALGESHGRGRTPAGAGSGPAR